MPIHKKLAVGGALRGVSIGLIIAVGTWLGCDSEEEHHEQTGTSPTGAGMGGQGAQAGAGGSGGQPALDCAVSLPQAVEGAFWGNPAVYPSLPIRVAVAGEATAVTVAIGSSSVSAVDGGVGTWTAELPVDQQSLGFHQVDVAAQCADGSSDATSAELGLGTEGVQHTVYADVGPAGTPMLHRLGDQLWLTWTGTYDGDREAWMQRLDGAGRFLGDRIQLTDHVDDTLYARTAFGADSVAVLYQRPGSPYTNHLKVVGHDGTERLAPIDLDPPSATGRPYGAMAFDGEGFVAVFRVSDTSGSEIRWVRVAEQTLSVTGPVVVAASGDGDPVGGFEPFAVFGVAAEGDLSMVSFVRDRYNATLATDLPKAQVAVLQRDGTVVYSAYAGTENGWFFDWESRVSVVDGRFVPYWTLTDLTDPAVNPPTLLHGTRADAQGALDPNRGNGTLMIDATYDRQEPFLTAHPSHPAMLVWTDLRSIEETPPGQIELWVAPVDDQLAVGQETIFGHARFIAGTSGLNAALAGTNVLMTWIDERHGSGLLDPKPEVYFETAWY